MRVSRLRQELVRACRLPSTAWMTPLTLGATMGARLLVPSSLVYCLWSAWPTSTDRIVALHLWYRSGP